jgi:cobalt-zinc-cadmium efflux system protein
VQSACIDRFEVMDADHHQQHAREVLNFDRAFAVGIGVNAAFVLVEIVYGIIGNSVALVADAGHNLSDVLGLLIAWGAAVLTRRPPDQRYTYGWRGSTILAALANAALLFVAVGAIGWEAVLRLLDPEPVAGRTVMVVAALGILINGLTASLFASGRKRDLNIRGAYLHMMADAGVSLGVVLAGAAILFTGWNWLDPITSLIVVAVILWGTWRLFSESLAMSLSAVPAEIDAEAVRTFLASYPGVTQVHDLHIWPMSTTETALTAHLVMPGGHPGDEFLQVIGARLLHEYGILHATLQIETHGTNCRFAPNDVV